MAEGRIVQIVGAVVDVEFPQGDLPPLYNALQLDTDSGDLVVLEVEQHIGDSRVRCVSMRPTEGLRRGTAVRDTDGPIRVPVGPETLGRVFDVTGEPVDGKGPCRGQRDLSNSPASPGLHRPEHLG